MSVTQQPRIGYSKTYVQIHYELLFGSLEILQYGQLLSDLQVASGEKNKVKGKGTIGVSPENGGFVQNKNGKICLKI